MDEHKLQRVIVVGKEFARQRICFLEASKHEAEGTLPLIICNNFFDIALLNWAHLFGNNKDDLHFRNVLDNPDHFKSRLMDVLGLDEVGWQENWQNLKNFRDYRVAHMGSDKSVDVPSLDIAYTCVCEYYNSAISELKLVGSKTYSSKPLEKFVVQNHDYYSDKVGLVFTALKN